MRELFLRVIGDGKRIVLTSSAKPEDLREYRRMADIDDLVERSKPFPDIFQAALHRLRVRPTEAVVVGDTPV